MKPESVSGCVPKELASSEILKQAERLNERANDIAMRVAEKLNPVCSPAGPTEECAGKDAESMPPLFNSLRSHMRSVSEALGSIEETLSRVEL